jgi:LDH2 family malate/lactate/ureidoglycolate dehydrogenase
MHSLHALALMHEKADGEARVAVHADPAQAVEHGLARLERALHSSRSGRFRRARRAAL